MTVTKQRSEPKRMTVLLPEKLERLLLAEKARIERDIGVEVSLTRIASRAMERGLGIDR